VRGRKSDDVGCGLFIIVAFVVAWGIKACSYADAQDAPRHSPPLAKHLVLARLGVKEESLFPSRHETVEEQRAHVRDGMSLINDVLERGAARTHTSYQRFAEQYSPDAFHPDATRPWIADLRVGAWRPAGWPQSLYWTGAPSNGLALNGYDLWMGDVADAVAIVKGRVPRSCPVPADHWGGPIDHERGLAEGWVPERCGNSRNEGWLVPAWHTADELALARASTSAAVPAAVARGRR